MKRAERTWEFFQANKTFSIEAFRIALETTPKDARRWLHYAEAIGMVKHIGGSQYESTGTYIQEDGEPCPNL